jgi:hypothetical protein
MKPNVFIELTDPAMHVRFGWRDFDGDDFFAEFSISVAVRGDRQRLFSFGGCAVYCLRKLRIFFGDQSKESTAGGFRHPDIRTFDLYRTATGLRLVIDFEESKLHEEFELVNPSIQVD